MKPDERINAFSGLGDSLRAYGSDPSPALLDRVMNENPWFTADNVRLAFSGILPWLETEALKAWTSPYLFRDTSPITVAIITAGNIPLAGFHDLLSVLISGNKVLIKPSSKDQVLMRFLVEKLLEVEPRFRDFIRIEMNQIKGFDAVIATGSDNSSRYFHQYFSKYPSIIRKNRTSVAILSGNESDEDLRGLGLDVFSYYGLGCRNVSKLLVPAGYKFDRLFELWSDWRELSHHHKYANNYDYQKSILLVNRTPHLDSGFVLARQEANGIVSPIATLYYTEYSSETDIDNSLEMAREKIQCIVGANGIPFGKAQFPGLADYADKVDTLAFLSSISVN